MERIFDLPAHPLLVHLPVVAIPVLAIAATVLAIVPSTRRRFGLAVSALAVVTVVSTFAAVSSGEELTELLDADEWIETHRDLGNALRWLVVGLALTTIALVYVGGSDSGPDLPTQASILLSVVVLAFAVLSLIWVIRTGHEGAKVHWEVIVPPESAAHAP